MKSLYLVRHAQSGWEDLALRDFDRPLDTQGQIEASKMGCLLNQNKEIPELVIASPANRTKQTAAIFCEQLSIDFCTISFQDTLYEASFREVLSVVNQIDNRIDIAMVICHNMSVSYLAEYLTNKELGSFETCCVVKLTFEMDDWLSISKDTAHLEFKWIPNLINV